MSRSTPAEPEGLHPLERALVSTAVAKRTVHFTAARWCAHLALASLGAHHEPLTATDTGAPAWPQGYTGSLTHTDDCYAAAVGSTSSYLSIGVDAERRGPLSSEVAELIASSAELDRLPPGLERLEWAKVIFSAKESIYKAHHPIFREPLTWGDVEITLDPSRGSFGARLVSAERTRFPTTSTLIGRFAVTSEVLATAVAVTAPTDVGTLRMVS